MLFRSRRQVWTGTAKLLVDLLEPLRENQSGYPSPVASFARLHSSSVVFSSQLAILHVASSTSLQMLPLVLQASRLTPLSACYLHLSPLYPSVQFFLLRSVLTK